MCAFLNGLQLGSLLVEMLQRLLQLGLGKLHSLLLRRDDLCHPVVDFHRQHPLAEARPSSPGRFAPRQCRSTVRVDAQCDKLAHHPASTHLQSPSPSSPGRSAPRQCRSTVQVDARCDKLAHHPASTHLQRPSAADDAFATFAGSKSGFVMYSLRILLMITGCKWKQASRIIRRKAAQPPCTHSSSLYLFTTPELNAKYRNQAVFRAVD